MAGLTVLEFGEWIVQQRWQKRLAAKQCAKAAGVSPQAWSEWETGKSRNKGENPPQPRRDTVQKVAIGLGVPLSEALIAAGYAPTVETSEVDFDHLPPDLQRVYGLMGKAYKVIPPGPYRDRYIANLRAIPELILNMEKRMSGEQADGE